MLIAVISTLIVFGPPARAVEKCAAGLIDTYYGCLPQGKCGGGFAQLPDGACTFAKGVLGVRYAAPGTPECPGAEPCFFPVINPAIAKKIEDR